MRKPVKITTETVERIGLVIHPKDRNAYVDKYAKEGYRCAVDYPLPGRSSRYLVVSNTRYFVCFERRIKPAPKSRLCE